MRLTRYLAVLSFVVSLTEAFDHFEYPRILQDILGLGRPAASNIPRFILDTEHPWLKDNQKWLSRYPNVRKAICDKTSLLWQPNATTTEQKKTTLPEDLFRGLKIVNDRYGDKRLGWINAIDRLREMNRCAAALQDVGHLQVEIYPFDENSYGYYSEPSMPPPDLPPLFADVLSSMTTFQPTRLRCEWNVV
jgi:hypothetical protein